MTRLTAASDERMKAAELIEQYPRLFHLTEAGGWPSGAAHSLLTTAQSVSTSGLSAEEQARIIGRRRLAYACALKLMLVPIMARLLRVFFAGAYASRAWSPG
jgi:hypothetical protein